MDDVAAQRDGRAHHPVPGGRGLRLIVVAGLNCREAEELQCPVRQCGNAPYNRPPRLLGGVAPGQPKAIPGCVHVAKRLVAWQARPLEGHDLLGLIGSECEGGRQQPRLTVACGLFATVPRAYCLPPHGGVNPVFPGVFHHHQPTPERLRSDQGTGADGLRRGARPCVQRFAGDPRGCGLEADPVDEGPAQRFDRSNPGRANARIRDQDGSHPRREPRLHSTQNCAWHLPVPELLQRRPFVLARHGASADREGRPHPLPAPIRCQVRPIPGDHRTGLGAEHVLDQHRREQGPVAMEVRITP